MPSRAQTPELEPVARRAYERAGKEYTSTVNGLDRKDPGFFNAEKRAWERLQRAVASTRRRYGISPSSQQRRKRR
jgi:hypothetical protein